MNINPQIGGLPLRWTGAVRRNHFNGAQVALESVACASPRFCVAAGGALEVRGQGAKRAQYERGYVDTFNGHAWSRPRRLGGQLQLASVSCPTTSFCAAVGNRITGLKTFAGYTVVYNGRSWSRPALRAEGPSERDGRSSELEMISCASRTFCVATNESGEVLRYDGKSWRLVVASYPTGGFVGLSCPAVRRCYAIENVPSSEWKKEVGPEGALIIRELPFEAAFALTFNGSAWSSPTVMPTTDRVTSLGCPTALFCMAGAGPPLTFNGSSWVASAPVSAVRYADTVSCASPSFCVVIEGEEAVRSFDGSSWTASDKLEATLYLGTRGVVALSCPTRSFCVLLDAGGRARYFRAGV